MLFQLAFRHAVFLAERRRAAVHRSLRGRFDLFVRDCLPDIFIAFQPAEIGAYRVPHVVDKELAPDIERKRRIGDQPHDIRNTAPERFLIHRKLAIGLHRDEQRVARALLWRERRNHTPNGCFHQSQIFIRPLLFLLRQILIDIPAHDLIRIKLVFREDDIERPAASLHAQPHSLCNIFRDMRQHVDADGTRHDIARRDGLDGLFRIRVHRAHIFDRIYLLSFV